MSTNTEKPAAAETGAGDRVGPSTAPIEINHLLDAARAGDDGSRDALLPILYRELHALAHRQMLKRSGSRGTLCTTALVNEAFLRLAHRQNISFENRAHFLAYAARVMRSIVIDTLRQQQSERRGGDYTRIEWCDQGESASPGPEQVLALDQALNQIEAVDPRLVRITELRVFGGLSVEECSEALGLSPRSCNRYWRRARAMLGTLLERSV